MEKGDRIKRARELCGMTQGELGSICGTTKQTIFKYENGVITNIPTDRIELIAEATGVSPAYIMGWTDDMSQMPSNILPMPAMVSRPRLGSIACGEPILAEQNIEGYDQIPDFVKCDFTLLCKGDSMIGARIHDGDVVCIKQQPEVENGQIAAVLVDGDEATLKRFYFENGTVTLQAENPAYPPKVFTGDDVNNVRVLGLATHFISKVR